MASPKTRNFLTLTLGGGFAVLVLTSSVLPGRQRRRPTKEEETGALRKTHKVSQAAKQFDFRARSARSALHFEPHLYVLRMWPQTREYLVKSSLDRTIQFNYHVITVGPTIL